MSPPIPFVVGVGRSGTTLLRMMLDAHSQLAIPPETGFITALPAVVTGPDAFLDAVCGFPTWPDMHLTRDAMRPRLQTLQPFSVAGALAVVYEAYAARFGKPRWGDKTPLHCLHMPAIQALFPTAVFIHLIRDGRDVAESVKGLWFAPGTEIAAIAGDWRDRILAARRDAARLRRYIEVRYEDLVREPRVVLRRLCDALELTLEDSMLRYHERAPTRLREHLSRYAADGSLVISHEQRVHNQRFTLEPPTVARIGRWRESMTEAEQGGFLEAAGELLGELGYLG